MYKIPVLVFLPIFIFSLIFLFAFSHYANNPRVLALMSARRHNFVHTVRQSNPASFYGVNVDMSQLLPGSQRYVVNSKGEDLIDTAAKLGVNIFRITNATPAFDGAQGAVYSKQQWYMVLDKMQEKGIKALILIESPGIYQKNITSDYLPFVQTYILDSSVLSHPAVYGIDLYNESVIDSHNIETLKTAAQMIKGKNPATKLTVGWWAVDTFQTDSNGKEIYDWSNYAAGKELDSFIDFYSIHMYGFDHATLGIYPDPYVYTQNFITQVKNGLQTTKSLLIEEFGAANGEAVSDQETLGSPQLQANTYAGVYQSLQDMKDKQLIGTVAYQFNTRSNGPDAWAILKDKGDYLFPAAYVLQKYATGKSDIPLSLPLIPVPNDYLFRNEDNNKTVTLKTNDILGLSLSLDPMYTYTASLSGDNTLAASEAFTYSLERKRYEAIFHAAVTGTTNLSILQKQSCSNSQKCDTSSKTIFSLIIVTPK